MRHARVRNAGVGGDVIIAGRWMREKSKRTTNGGVRSRLFERSSLRVVSSMRRDGLYVGRSTYNSLCNFLEVVILITTITTSSTTSPSLLLRVVHSFATALAMFQVGECYLVLHSTAQYIHKGTLLGVFATFSPPYTLSGLA